MKHTLTLALVGLLALSLQKTSAQNKAVPAGYTSYGAAITTDGAISTEEFARTMAKADSVATKLACEVITSCTVKGCWMDVVMPEGGSMKVKFKDYGFFVPKTGMEGKQAILQGYATRETLSVEMQRHYLEDAGKSVEEIAKITEPKYTLFFLADGVLIAE